MSCHYFDDILPKLGSVRFSLDLSHATAILRSGALLESVVLQEASPFHKGGVGKGYGMTLQINCLKPPSFFLLIFILWA